MGSNLDSGSSLLPVPIRHWDEFKKHSKGVFTFENGFQRERFWKVYHYHLYVNYKNTKLWKRWCYAHRITCLCFSSQTDIASYWSEMHFNAMIRLNRDHFGNIVCMQKTQRKKIFSTLLWCKHSFSLILNSMQSSGQSSINQSKCSPYHLIAILQILESHMTDLNKKQTEI